MLKKEWSDKILDKTPLDYYLSANDGCRVKWPYRMQPTDEASPMYASTAEKYAIDSAIMKPELGNKEALSEAIRLEADYLLLADYLPFEVYWKSFNDRTPEERKAKVRELEEKYTDNYEASVESIKRGLDMVKESDFTGTVWVPLQKPHYDMYCELGKPKNIAIGGIKDSKNAEKVEYAMDIREKVGKDVYIHALGVGVTDEFASMVRQHPNVIDSIDCQTTMASANHMEYMPGEDRMTPTAVHSLGFLLENCRRMTDLVDVEKKNIDGSVFDY